MLFSVFILIGLLGSVHGVIDWAAAIGAAAAAGSAVTGGASMLQSMLGAPGYSVVCTVEIENWTKFPLVYPESTVNTGYLKHPPVAVLPGKKEAFIAHKVGNTATGTHGSASWLISSNSRRAVVMWSSPYSFDFHSNWLGIGITTPGETSHKDWADQMYYDNSGNGLNFVRGEYYYNTKTLSIKDSKFEVVGTMGTGHIAKVKLIVRPREVEDLAPPLKTVVEDALKKKK